MIPKILSLKQHKTQHAMTQMHLDEKTLEQERKALQQIQQTIETLIVAQHEDSDRLFDDLAKAPATIIELEAYNATLAKMKHALNKLHLEQTAIETRVEAAHKQLLTSQDAVRVATQKQEKFTCLSQNINEMARIESEYQEDQLLDEIIDTRFSSPASASAAHGVF